MIFLYTGHNQSASLMHPTSNIEQGTAMTLNLADHSCGSKEIPTTEPWKDTTSHLPDRSCSPRKQDLQATPGIESAFTSIPARNPNFKQHLQTTETKNPDHKQTGESMKTETTKTTAV
jgi:hypothetical protein